AASTRRVRATTRPASRITAICSGVLVSMLIPPTSPPRFLATPHTGPLPAYARTERGHGPAGDLFHRAGRVDADQDVLVGVEGEKGEGLLGVDLDPVPDRLLGVVVPLEELAAAVIADAGAGGRVVQDVP